MRWFVYDVDTALEGFTAIRDGQVAAGIAYLLVTFVLGLSGNGRRVSRNASGFGSSNVSAEASADTNAATTSKEVRRDDRIPTNLGLPVYM